MSHFNASSASGDNSIHFLERYPHITGALLEDCNFNRNEVLDIINHALRASHRCQMTSFYIQAVVTGQTTFLMTNLNQNWESLLIGTASTWLIGRSPTCAITIPEFSVSRCHAVIGYHPIDGFYITDVGSRNGTFVNRRRIAPRERRTLRDGDLLQLGELRTEFFLASRKQHQPVLYEATYS
ncbi:MAG TPA: FHA domain-containing protein [Crinalium sp.]|jgi:hypothetical protein